MTLAAIPHAGVRVLDVWDETPTLVGMRLEMPFAFARAHERPGQVVKIATPEGEGYFALASAPATEPRADLLVKRGGKVSDAAIVGARQRGELDVSAPFGKGFPWEEARGRDVLLFAAGSGIAPVRALVQHLAANRRAFGRLTLFYGQRHGSEFAYTREHLDWERSGVRVVLCPSQEDDAWPGVRGRVQEVARALAFGGAEPSTAVAFVCGMTAMVAEVKVTLADAGVPPARIHHNF
jgi:sulfhydrogenase subunit gamma (sulfur reductase)